MKVKKIIITIIIFCISIPMVTASDSSYEYYDEKDPFVAGLLSATMMGLGQFYTKEYTKGSIFVLTDFLQKGMLVWMIVALNDKYTDDENGDQVVEWQEISDGDKAWIIGYIAFYFGSTIYCVIDAVHSANVYNREIHKQREKMKSGLNFQLDLERKNITAMYSRRF
ncbi:MAG: hypothetical protein JW827_06220 [Spirochaetes bacterium]|nr:hypothetical protein [Spirochaetota bacterium]